MHLKHRTRKLEYNENHHCQQNLPNEIYQKEEVKNIVLQFCQCLFATLLPVIVFISLFYEKTCSKPNLFASLFFPMAACMYKMLKIKSKINFVSLFFSVVDVVRFLSSFFFSVYNMDGIWVIFVDIGAETYIHSNPIQPPKYGNLICLFYDSSLNDIDSQHNNKNKIMN